MKILDRYILTQFLKNFISTLFILMLIFIFYTIWMYIDEFAGRGVEIWIIIKFIFLNIPFLSPIILPLTVVLSSIMTFGSLAENYEFAAIKASGISLLRIMRILIVFMIFLCIGTFFLANNVTPLTREKTNDLRINVGKLKPAMAIREGIFSDIGDNISIKVGKKSGKNDQYLDNVIIHKKNKDQVNRTVIKAEKGELISIKNSGRIQLVLTNGNYYEDVKTDNYQAQKRYPFAKTKFEKHIMNIDLSQLNKVDLNEKNKRGGYQLMNVNQLSQSIDSITKDYEENLTAYGESLYRRTGISYIDPIEAKIDTTTTPQKDSIEKNNIKNIEDIIALYQDWRRVQLFDLAIDNNKGQLSNFEFKKEDIERRNKLLNLHYIYLNDKFALSVACFVLFFVGAPLGAIIRKGGIGLPLVVAMGVFLSYHFIGLFTKNFAETGTISPVLAPWIPTLLLLPLGIILTIKVTSDKGLWEGNNIFENIKTLFNKKHKSQNR